MLINFIFLLQYIIELTKYIFYLNIYLVSSIIYLLKHIQYKLYIMSKLTEEQIKYNSILETQKSLIELGEKKQIEKNKIENLNTRYLFLDNQISNNMTPDILSIKIKSILSSHYSTDRTDKLLELFAIYNEYFIMNKNIITNFETINNKLEDDYNSLREENNLTNKEYDEKQTYWENRVKAIREKCINRNNKIIKLENRDLWNTYNILIKNTLLFFICIFNIDLIEFINEYLFLILFVVFYSFYINYQIIMNYSKEKIQ